MKEPIKAIYKKNRNCGTECHKFGRNYCPAIKFKCHLCGKRGHSSKFVELKTNNLR